MPSLLGSVTSAISRNSNIKKSTTKINVPSKDGRLEDFTIYEASVFSPELAAKYPQIKSYVGFSNETPGTRLRMSVSPQGVQTMITYLDGSNVFMQPLEKGSNEYIVYKTSSKNLGKNNFLCKTIEDFKSSSLNKSSSTSKIYVNEGGANTKLLQKFRIAISTTGEYTQYHNDNNAANGNAVADALAAINATINRVNEVFETDMAIRFEVINAPQLIYTNAATDPYSDASVGTDEENFNNLSGWSLQLQKTLSTNLGSNISQANNAYDIGHLFGATGGGGNAGCIGCVCEDDTASDNDHKKGSGYTSPSNGIPEGDTFDIDFVAHEIGHQMGATHMFAYDTENAGTNSEPGSGSTVMAYAGITGANNVQTNSDDYFHYHSIKQILTNIVGKCQTTDAIINNPPIANAGPDYHIPAGTAYVLKGSATDLDGTSSLTYCWEQIDSGSSNYLNFGPDLVNGPVNRSLPPSNQSSRFIPKFSSVIAGKTTQTNPTLGDDWETVSTVARDLNWALTVRDRSPNNYLGGQSSYDTMVITVENVTPFTVNNPIAWVQGSTQTITWNVGATNNTTINCQSVNIKLSTNGGLTFPTIIAANVPNNGSYSYTVPSIPNTENARILIEAADNIFYDVSDFNFIISPNPNFLLVNENLDPIDCKDTSATINFDYQTANGFSQTTTFSASGLPPGSNATFLPSSLNTSGTVTMIINNLDTAPLGDYTITVRGTSNSIVKNKLIDFPFYNGICNSEGTTEYATGTTFVEFNTISNVTGKTVGYNDYKANASIVNRNASYPLTVQVNTDGDFDTNTLVWIDWNQNCIFDANETYNLGTATNVANGATSLSPLNITVPANAVLGLTTMRVTTKYADGTSVLPCELGFDGEVEDYSLNVVSTLSVEDFGFENFNVYPNPNNGNFTIKLSGSVSKDIQVSVYDLRGRSIFNKVYKNVGDFNENISLNQVQSGMYLLKVNDGLRHSTKKIIIK